MRYRKRFTNALGALLALFLAACTGSQEAPLPALVAAGGQDRVGFYRAQDLQGGGASPVATWSAPGLQDLAYSNTFQALYLLFPDRVEAYGTTGFTADAAPQGTPSLASLPADCTGGYLRLGQNTLLAHCPAAGRAFLLTLPDLAGLQEADLTGLPTGTGVRLALFPQGSLDLLAYLTDLSLGYRPSADPTGTPSRDRPLGLAGFTPTDLRLDPGLGRLLGAGNTLVDTYGLRLEGDNLLAQTLGLPPSGPVRLALDPVQGLVAYGQGFRVLAPQDSGPRRTAYPYGAGLVGQDAYLYLAQGGSLEVYDLQALPLAFSPQALSFLGYSPSALAFVPVQ